MQNRRKQDFVGALLAEGVCSNSPGTTELYRDYLKRGFDFFFSFTILALIMPFLMLIGLIASHDGAFPVFAHERIGLNGRRFKCLKFRTMRPDADTVLEKLLKSDPYAAVEWKKNHKLANDPRITFVGKWLRRTSLDELPQLVNVLLGDMSLVGPRPITLEETGKYKAHLPKYLALRPGLTGMWQVYGRGIVEYEERVEMDANYSKKINFTRDIRLLLLTFNVVLQSRGQ